MAATAAPFALRLPAFAPLLLSACCLAVFVSSLTDMSQSNINHRRRRFILVTGGNKGIGRAVCERLVTEWADTVVFVGSRDRGRGEQAVNDMVKSTRCDPSRLSCLQIDTSSDASVQEAAGQLSIRLNQQQQQQQQQQPKDAARLYGIVNNAGVRVVSCRLQKCESGSGDSDERVDAGA
jgi:NAD(P)-dependent dehydrogenase (short-subunit alcohol dehydrogenase family)